MYKLNIKKKKESKVKMAYIAEIGFINTSNSYLLPLFSSFNFDFSFLILLDVISDNTPVPFL